MAYRLTERATVKILTSKIDGQIFSVSGFRANEEYLLDRK